MSEFIYSPIIPIRVTLNEYIELSKEFSTEKSKLFVNGLLDKLVVDLRVSGKIQKIKTSEENSNQDNITE
jgi:N utilization substance protein B